jgi:hypothetical protein
MEKFEDREDVVRRGVKRELPCKMTDEEFTRVARQRAAKEAERTQLETDLAREKKKRQDQIGELDDEIGKMGRELHTGEQERTVPCNDVFRRAFDGTGWIHTLRMDTFDEVERRPATAHETQRYLPTVDGGDGNIIDQAETAQRSAQDETEDVPGGGDDDGDEAKPTAKPKRKGAR